MTALDLAPFDAFRPHERAVSVPRLEVEAIEGDGLPASRVEVGEDRGHVGDELPPRPVRRHDRKRCELERMRTMARGHRERCSALPRRGTLRCAFVPARAEVLPRHRGAGAVLFLAGMKGIRYALRNFTALSVKEHLRSQIDGPGGEAELTPNEVELVRFAAERSDQLKQLADRSSAG